MGWTLQPQLAWQVIDGEAVIVDLESGGTIGLNPTGTLIWSRLANSSEAEIISALISEFGIDEETARRDFHEFMSQLEARNVVARS